MSKADKKIYGLVKQSIKLLKNEPGLRLSFCFIEQKGSPVLRIFYIDKKKGTKPVKFATVKKISAFLTTLGSESFGTRARSCAGTVSYQDDTFVFTVTHKVGISPALLEKSVKKLNTMFKLGIGSMSLAGGESAPKSSSSGKRYAWYEKELNRIYETQKSEYPSPSTVLGALSIPPKSILDSMLGLIEEYEEKDPVDTDDKQNPAKIDTALDWLYAYLDESDTQKEAQETMGVDAATFASLLPFYRYANNNAKRIIAPLFAEEVDNLVQKAEDLRNILPPNLRGHASAAAIPQATIDSPQGSLFVDEQVPVQCDLFLRSYTLERVLQLEAYSPFDQHLRQSKELRIELKRLLNEYILLPYQSVLQELMQAEGSKAVSQAEELHQELNGAAKADRVNKALFTVLKAKESQKKKVRTVELVRRNDNKLNEFNTLSRHLEGSPLEADVNALITDLQKGSSDQYPGVEVHLGSFISLEAIVSNRFGGLNEFSVAYLTELMRTGRINNVWSLINSLGLVANSHIQVPLALDLLNKMSADEKREALNKPKVRERVESLIKPDFFGSKNNYAAIFKEHLAYAQSDEDSGSEEDKATGHRIAVQFYCMVRDGYENLSKAIALLQNWMEKSKIETVKSLQDEFRGKFKELAGLSRVRSKFSSKDAQHCNNIIQSYIDQYERLNESKVQTDKIPPEDIKAIADLDALLETGSVEKLNHAIQNLRADQKERYLTSLLEDEFDKLDLQNPSLNEELKQKVYDKALGQLRERMEKKGCKEADIRNMESAFLFDAKEESLHATIRRKVDTLSLQNILDKIHSVSAKDIDQLKTSIQSIIHDFKLLKSLWDKGEGAQRDELFKILGVTYSKDSKGFISHTESKRFETAKDQFQLLQPDNLEATRNVLSAEWNTLPPEEQEVYGNQRKFVGSKLHALEELTIDGEKIDGMSAAFIKQHIDILKKEQEKTPQEDIQQKIRLLETACASVEAKKLAPPIPVKDNTAYENEKILGENASFTEDPNFWGAQINKTLNVMLRTDADLSSAAQMVYKAQDSMITTWYKMSDAEQAQYPDKETFVKQKMYGIWTQLSSDVQQWLKSESMTSRMGGNKEIKKQICHALESYSESNTLQSETMLMQKGDTVNASLTDIENAFDVISTFELLEKYSNYRMLQPKTDEMSLLSQQKFSKESQALDIKREYDALLAKEATWEQSPPEQPEERESVAQQKEEKKNRYDLLRQEVEDIETQQKEVRDGIDGFTLDVRPDQIEKLWNSGGWGRSNLRKIELLNLVRSKIAHHATTEEGRAFLKEKLPGYAIDALSSNKLLVLSDLTKQKSKDTGVQWDLFSNASSMRKEGASRLLGEVREVHETLKGKSDLEREEIRKEAAEKIQEKREELNERTEEFDRVRAKATQITIAIISVVASIAVGIASAGIGTVAGGLLINTLLVAGKAVIVEGARKYLQGDEVALREAVARIAAATIIEHLGAHIGAFTSELTALTEESIEANSGLDQFFSDKLNTEIQAGPLSKVITQYPVATGLAAAAGSSVGATAAVIAQNEGGLKAGLRDLKDTLIDEVKNFHKTFFVELTKTLVTDSDNVNQDNFATFAVHDAVASEIVAPALNQSQARYTRIDAIRKKLHTDIDTIEVDLTSLEQNLTTLTSMRASVSFIRKKLEKNLVDLETNFKSYYKASDGRKDCKEKIKVLYRDQKKFQDMFMKFKQERDEFRAQKDRFFESISSTEKEAQEAAVMPELVNVIQLKLSDAQAKTNIFGKIERWISNTEPFLTDASQRIAKQRERYDQRGEYEKKKRQQS